MKAFVFENIIEITLEWFPEYKETSHYADNDHELAYSFFYGFTDYLTQLVEKSPDPIMDSRIRKIFDLFNAMVSSSDDKLSTLFVVEVLPNLVQDKKTKDITLQLLNDEGKKHLMEVLKYTGVSD